MPDASAPGFAKRPDYPLTVETFQGRVRTSIAGIVLADSRRIKLLRESPYPPVFYFPASDVRIDEFLEPTDHATTCPYKGQASYWSFTMGDRVEDNIAWAYGDPYRETATIAGHLSFYWDRMDCWFLDDKQITRPPA